MLLQRERHPASCIKPICSRQVAITISLTPVPRCTPCRTGIPILVLQPENKLFTNRVKVDVLSTKQVLGSPTAWGCQAKGETIPLFQIHVFLKQYREDHIHL